MATRGLISLITVATIICLSPNIASALECVSENVFGVKVALTCPRPWDEEDKIFCCGAACCNVQQQTAKGFEKVGHGVLDTFGVDDSNLTTGTIVAIGFGAVIALIILIVIFCRCCPCCCCYKSKQQGVVYIPQQTQKF